MKNIYLVLIIIFSSWNFSGEPPQAEISNGLITATLYLPDAENGYYRGTRFDWSGQVSSLIYKGHSFFGKWFDKYDPLSHDAIMGPVEAFDPVGYDEATTGGSFLKTGIGMLKKPEEKEYFFANSYQIVNGGSWRTQKSSNEIVFTHLLDDSLYSYEYTKTVKLLPGQPKLVLTHTLKNTGKKAIATKVMNHNFFVIDNQPTGTDFTVDFNFDLKVKTPDKPVLAKAEGRRVFFVPDTSGIRRFYLGDIYGFSNSSNDYNITLKNNKTGAAVNITCDQPISRLYFWAADKTICPEPYISIMALPGQSASWTITYHFMAPDENNNVTGMNNLWTTYK